MVNGIDDIFHLEDEESEQCKITLADPCSYFISTSSYHKDIELSVPHGRYHSAVTTLKFLHPFFNFPKGTYAIERTKGQQLIDQKIVGLLNRNIRIITLSYFGSEAPTPPSPSEIQMLIALREQTLLTGGYLISLHNCILVV
ncbi:hypothetical protein KQX54_017403 [Cotesia glomerata]|uniref:Uncharacterized protein n=1 Tax=Cotesia glomerata TaxID=32391 RepID=A0AAV7IG50_COTGL|nr:hypothetical protein KQX54_017403 [Cotesia glomerata]